MFKTNFQATNPYLLLGVPRSVTPEHLQAAVVAAYSTAAGNPRLNEKIASAHQQVLEDMHTAQGLRQTDDLIASVSAGVERMRHQLGVGVGVDPSARPFTPGPASAGASAGAGSWGPTVGGQVFEPGEQIPHFTQESGNPYEVRQGPGFASAEFLGWEKQYNKYQLEQHMHPTGKYNGLLAFFCFVGAIFGILIGFWGWAFSTGLGILADTEAARQTLAAQGGWGMEQYAAMSMVFLLMIVLSFCLFFVPTLVKVLRRRRVAERVAQLHQVGVAQGWLLF